MNNNPQSMFLYNTAVFETLEMIDNLNAKQSTKVGEISHIKTEQSRT